MMEKGELSGEPELNLDARRRWVQEESWPTEQKGRKKSKTKQAVLEESAEDISDNDEFFGDE